MSLHGSDLYIGFWLIELLFYAPFLSLPWNFSLGNRTYEILIYLELSLEEGFLRVELAGHEVNQVTVRDD